MVTAPIIVMKNLMIANSVLLTKPRPTTAAESMQVVALLILVDVSLL